MLPDVAPIGREFDYLVPREMGSEVRVGTIVRIMLHGRRVRGWVVADDVTPPTGVSLRALSKVRGWGPAAEVMELAEWAAWRWAGAKAALLRSASPPLAVPNLPRPLATSSDHIRSLIGEDESGLIDEALSSGKAIVRVAPAADLLAVVLHAAALGPSLVVTASLGQAEELGRRLRSLGVGCAVVPREWAQAAAGAPVVLGARVAAWAPCSGLRCVVVLDGHEEALQQEQAPTWNAWVVAAERARRAGVPCVVVTSCPTLELLAWRGARLHRPSRERERLGWAALEVVDRRRDDPRSGLYSPRLVGLLRGQGRVLCVLNRKGRARLLACGACGELVRCERCGASVSLAEETLTCPRCGQVRPAVCVACGSMRLKALRIGVSRAREELEQLAGREVGEVTADVDAVPDAPVLVGTEAVLRRVVAADAVAFLDFDQELLAPRYRAGEEALGLLALASRLVGGRTRSGRVMVQTRVPHHDAIASALTADPGHLAAAETVLRAALALPPAVALALVSGSGAEEFVAGLGGVDVLGPDRGRFLVKADGHERLSAALAAVPRPSGRRLRVEVDPLRL